jgi:hypothetical protein
MNIQETKTQREIRKNMYISYVLSRARDMGNIEDVVKEASLKWESENEEKFFPEELKLKIKLS